MYTISPWLFLSVPHAGCHPGMGSSGRCEAVSVKSVKPDTTVSRCSVLVTIPKLSSRSSGEILNRLRRGGPEIDAITDKT